MRVSVVIRTFNSERTIERVLEALRSQSFEDFGVVIVDSGSSDKTLEIIEHHSHTFVDYSHNKFTYGGSLNAGFSVAEGEYVVSLSSHCIPLHERWLENLVGAMDRNRQLAAASGPLVLFDPINFAVDMVNLEAVEILDLEGFYKKPNQGLQNPNSIVRRELWVRRHFSEELDRCEDQEWIHHFLIRGYKSATVRGAPALYSIPYGPIKYSKKIVRDFLVLNDLFGFRPVISTKDLYRRVRHQARAAIVGNTSVRAGELTIASAVGRWLAYRGVLYRESRNRKGRQVVVGSEPREGTLGAEVEKHRAPRMPAARLVASLDQKTRFFLVGEMRSGTSWLARTLNTHPEILCKGEGSFFGRQQEVEEIPVYRGPTPSLHNALLNCEGLRTWHAFSWNAWAKGELEEDLLNLTQLAIDYYLAKDSADSGKRIVGDKSPLHTDHVDEIFDFYPGAKVIHILRDGRDVAVSLMHHFWRLAKDKGGIFDLNLEELAKRDAYIEDPQSFLRSGNGIFSEELLRQMAVRWSRRVSKASRDGSTIFGPNFFQLRYEDLLANPEEALKSMFVFLGANDDDDVVKRCIEDNRFEKLAQRQQGDEDSGSFYRKGVIGDWRNVFTEHDRQIYKEIAGDTLQQMGYSLE